jgi:hypothetical protein
MFLRDILNYKELFMQKYINIFNQFFLFTVNNMPKKYIPKYKVKYQYFC